MSYKIFAPIYLILVTLTYFVRGAVFLLIGSSAIDPTAMAFNPAIGIAGALQQAGIFCLFASTMILLSIYISLCVVAWKRGVENNYSSRLFCYPLVAGLFDILLFVPFVPTVLLLIGFFIGTKEYVED